MDQETDTLMPDVVPPPSAKSKKRKSTSQSHEIKSITIKTPAFSYIHLTLLSSSPSQTPSVDILTFRTYLTRALTQFLGLTGSAISIDILKTKGRELWIRVPREDCSAVVAAVGGWAFEERGSEGEVAWRVRGTSNWLGSLVGQEDIKKVWGN